MRQAAFVQIGASVVAFMLVAALETTDVCSAEAMRSTKAVVEMRLSSAMTGLDRFRTTGSVDELARTSHDLRSSLNHSDLLSLSASDLLMLRRQYVANYAELFNAIEGLEDPAFVESDDRYRPLLCVMPPREPNGHQAPSCADPSEIADPMTRATYVAALQANADRTKQINLQRHLRYIDDEVTVELKLVLQKFRGRTPNDTPALDGILTRAHVRDSRKSAIHAMY